MELWDTLKNWGKKAIDVADVVIPVVQHPFDTEKRVEERAKRESYKRKYGYRKVVEDHLKDVGKKAIDTVDEVAPIVQHPFDSEKREQERKAREEYKRKYGYRRVAEDYKETAERYAKEAAERAKPVVDRVVSEFEQSPLKGVADKARENVKEAAERVQPAVDWATSKFEQSPLKMVADKAKENAKETVGRVQSAVGWVAEQSPAKKVADRVGEFFYPSEPAKTKPSESDTSSDVPPADSAKPNVSKPQPIQPSNHSSMLAFSVNQTGLSPDKAEKYILPLLGREKGLEEILIGLNERGRSAFFLDRLGKEIQRSNDPRYIFADLYRATADEKGKIPQSVKDSPALGSMIKLFRDNIPDNVKKAIPESELDLFLFATAARVAATEEGKKATVDALHQLHPDADFAKIAKEAGIDKLMAYESLNELSSRPRWKQYYDEFNKGLQTEDSVPASPKENVSNPSVPQTENPTAEEKSRLPLQEMTETLSGGISATLKGTIPLKMTTVPEKSVAQNGGISGRLKAIQGEETSPHEPVKPLDNTLMQAAAKKHSHVA
ncbi:MAG: hypothetical protein IKS41_06920 [Alphaproteobacteria bacterium]|nr:hypothetical protein [Alphaproteobacteria bacterium]